MTGRFDISTVGIAGVSVVQRKPIGDERGYLERMFCLHELQSLIGDQRIVQINTTLTVKRGTVRGMHFQKQPHAEIKFVSCLRGAVFDVAVDVRQGSTTFLRWHGEVLSAQNRRTLVLPAGVAHGFQAMTEDCELIYFHTAAFDPVSEGGLHPQDPMLAIQWPEPITELSLRDSSHPPLAADFAGLIV
jgi:dTDP-4-dehydrorhamnose 3,5-epimerase